MLLNYETKRVTLCQSDFASPEIWNQFVAQFFDPELDDSDEPIISEIPELINMCISMKPNYITYAK